MSRQQKETVIPQRTDPEKRLDPRELIQQQAELSKQEPPETNEYLLSASGILQYTERLSALDWRHFGAGSVYFNENLYYVGQIGKLVREKHPHKSPHWNKIGKFFFSTLMRNNAARALEFRTTQVKFDPLDQVKSCFVGKEKFIDPPEFRNNADCELPFDSADGGHGYQRPKLIVLKKNLFLVFISRGQVRGRPFCKPLSSRSLYICRIVFRYRGWTSRNYELASCENPIKLRREIDGKVRSAKTHWIPFIYQEQLLFLAGFYPQHVVVDCTDLVLKNASSCVEIQNSTSTEAMDDFQTLPRGYDSLITGTKALLVDGLYRRPDYYTGAVTYLYSNRSKDQICHSFMYEMETRPPFRITSFKPINLTTATSENFLELSQKGPSFYKKFYSSSMQCAVVEDATELPRNDWSSRTQTRRTIAIFYGVSGVETRVFETELI